MTEPTKPKRRRLLRFSLRMLFIAMTVLCALCDWLTFEVQAARRQKEAVKALLQAGSFEAFYDYQCVPAPGPRADWSLNKSALSPNPAWLRKMTGDDLLCNVTGLNRSWPGEWNKDNRISESNFAQIARLPELRVLCLRSIRVVSDDGTVERRLNSSDLSFLSGLTNLGLVNLADTDVDSAGLAYLVGLRRLSILLLERTRVDDLGMERIGKMRTLWALELQHTRVSDAGLIAIQNLTELESLDLRDTNVSDAGLQHLKGLSKLGTLWLDNSRVTAAGILELQKSLPHCKISGP